MVRFDFDVVSDALPPKPTPKPPSDRSAMFEEAADSAAAGTEPAAGAERLRPPPTDRPS